MASDVRLTPEILVTRLGDYLVERGTLTTEQLKQALEHQKKMREAGNLVLIGQVLLDLAMVTRETLDQAVTEQILKLRAALQESNQQLERRVQERTAELQAALKKLSELNQLKSNIIANVSHELRTPMTHIKGYIELLSDGTLGSLNSEQSDAINVMKKSSQRLEQLIEEMIHFSLASKGEFTLNIRPIDLVELCNMVINRSKSKADEQNVHLLSRVSPNLPAVKGDEEKISWVMLQLLDNAIKFTISNGQVVLSAEPEDKFVKISVSDNGIGIPKDRIPELFEAFHQLDGSSTRRHGGTGLGLALVRQIIEAHGSVIRVYSKERKGSRFEFILPIAQ